MVNLFQTNRLERNQTPKTESKRNEVENRQRAEWLKHKGMDTFDAMQLYIERVRELAASYPPRVVEVPNEKEDGKGKK